MAWNIVTTTGLIKKHDRMVESLMEFVEFSSDKSVAPLKSTKLVACFIFFNLFVASARRMQRVVGNNRWLLGFLPAYCSEEKLEGEKSVENEEISIHQTTSLIMVPCKRNGRITAFYNFEHEKWECSTILWKLQRKYCKKMRWNGSL